MAVSAEKVLNDLKNGQFATIYFLSGEEPFFIDAIVSELEKNAIPESEKGFNQVIMYGRDVSLGKFVSAARAFPMMGQRQLVMLKEAQHKDLWKIENEVKLLMDYIKNPQPSTIMVIAHKGKLDKRSSLAKAVDSGAVFVATEKIREFKIKEWIVSYVNSLGYQINDRAALMLSELIGNNLEKINNELQKIILNLKGEKLIDENLVEKNVGFNKEFNVFELSNALSFRDFNKAVRICDYFANDQKANPIQMTIGYIYGYWVKVAKVHTLGQGAGQDQIAKHIGVHPFIAKEYITAARNYPLAKVVQNIHFLRQADLQTKGVSASNMAEKDIFREMLFKFMH